MKCTRQVGKVAAVLLAAAVVLVSGWPAARADVFTNVPEAANYSLVYTLPIPNGCNFSGSVPYSLNNAAGITTGSFSRVAYYLELQQGANPLQYVYASFDAAPFATNASKLGVPNAASGEFYHYDTAGLLPGQVRNMNVYSNVSGLVGADRTGVTTGNVEFWATNYGGGNDYGVPGAAGSFDFGDGGAGGGGTYGSMQIHDYGLGKTLFAFNNWNGGGGDLGIGNRPTGDPDWTFAGNIGSYSVKNLQVLVLLPPVNVWNGSASNNWETSANWTPNGMPTGAGVTVTLGQQTAPGSNVVDLGAAGKTLGAMTFAATSGTTVQSTLGQTLTFDNSGSPSSITVAGTHSITAPIALNNNLAIQGAGTLTLTNTLTNNGKQVTINGATLQIGAGGTSGTLGSGAVTNNGSLVINRSDSFTLTNDVAGTGSLTQAGAGTTTLGGSMTYSGATIISAGTLQLGGTGGPAPSALPGSIWWLDASTGVTLSGSSVTSWADLSGSNRGVAQVTAANQPIYVPGALNGQPVVRFDGADDKMVINGAGGQASARTIFIVKSLNGAQKGLAGITGLDGGDKGIRMTNSTTWQTTGDGNDFTNPAGSEFRIDGVVTGTQANDNTYHILSATRATSNQNLNAIGS